MGATRWVLVLLLVAWAPQVRADEMAKYEEQIEQFGRVLASLEAKDELKSAVKEIGVMRNWLLEARMLVRDDKPEELQRLLKRMTPEVKLIEAIIAQGMAERRAQEQEQEADALEARLRKLKREKDLLEKRVALLEKQKREREGTAPQPAGGAGQADGGAR